MRRTRRRRGRVHGVPRRTEEGRESCLEVCLSQGRPEGRRGGRVPSRVPLVGPRACVGTASYVGDNSARFARDGGSPDGIYLSGLASPVVSLLSLILGPVEVLSLSLSLSLFISPSLSLSLCLSESAIFLRDVSFRSFLIHRVVVDPSFFPLKNKKKKRNKLKIRRYIYIYIYLERERGR